ncbi:MAG TPA: sigma-70 family RNA polymerase sigma factor [Candidatus Elarobacter sp.]|nr:sigma-70 family RNA polymerase sigma factor [Candidatus Elarobacter sp.]
MEALIAAVWPYGWRLAYAVLGDRAAAEDVAQEAALAMMRGLPALRDDARFASWFSRIVVRCALRSRRAGVFEIPGDVERAVSGDAFAAAEQRVDLRAAARRLTRRERAALYLAASGYTGREIGAAMDVVPGTARVVLFMARRKLRVALAEGAAPRAPREVHVL